MLHDKNCLRKKLAGSQINELYNKVSGLTGHTNLCNVGGFYHSWHFSLLGISSLYIKL